MSFIKFRVVKNSIVRENLKTVLIKVRKRKYYFWINKRFIDLSECKIFIPDNFVIPIIEFRGNDYRKDMVSEELLTAEQLKEFWESDEKRPYFDRVEKVLFKLEKKEDIWKKKVKLEKLIFMMTEQKK